MDRADFPWRSLGRILVEDELLTSQDLERALAEQRETVRRLGEILVQRGRLSRSGLASALAEQHGLSLEAQLLAAEPGGVGTPSATPSYRVCLVGYKAREEQRTFLFESPNLLDAADFACEYVDQEEPIAVEIDRVDEKGAETVWTYSRDRAEAEAAASKPLVETFGFDPTLWSIDT